MRNNFNSFLLFLLLKNIYLKVKKILIALKKLKHLNLCNNPLKNAHIGKASCQVKNEQENEHSDEFTQEIESMIPLADISNQVSSDHFDFYFMKNWSIDEDENKLTGLKTIILNNCYIDNKILELLLIRLPALEELHLARNEYKKIQFSNYFRKESLKIIYLNSNCLSDWKEVSKLGICMPNLETLVLSENRFGDIPESINFREAFPKLKALNMNELNVDTWDTIDNLRELASLKNIRLKGKIHL